VYPVTRVGVTPAGHLTLAGQDMTPELRVTSNVNEYALLDGGLEKVYMVVPESAVLVK
jgi:hypothetical protein